MRTTHNNRIRMFKTTNSVLEENKAAWTAMAPFAAAVQDFKDKIFAIDLAAQKQETATAGAALDRASAREALEDVLFLASEALGVLAHSADDNELRDLTDVRPSGLQRLSDEELANFAHSIVAQTSGRKTELATLQVSDTNMTELNEALDDFEKSKSAPRAAIANRMAQTESLAEQIREANDILRNQLDRMVNLFRRSHPDFVAAYRGARVIVDRPATHKSAPGIVPTPPAPPKPQPAT